jgi:hypothetical protein
MGVALDWNRCPTQGNSSGPFGPLLDPLLNFFLETDAKVSFYFTNWKVFEQ